MKLRPTILPLTRLLLAGMALLLAAGAPFSHAGGGPQNVLLVVNGQSQSSLEVANEYQQLRRLPEENVFHLAPSNTAAFYTGGDLRRTMTSGLFRTNVLWPVFNYLRTRGLTNHIDYIVYSADIPTRIDCAAESNVTSIAGAPVFPITALTA
ncbi:MAG: hypothetical protein HC814_06740, partial [Rhodobacteraceae bacterium]|nr:hypothetical protein [Paracoccaceae bacterium]